MVCTRKENFTVWYKFLKLYLTWFYFLQRYYGSKPPSLYKVTVKVGEREFSGEGLTAQAARHDAAAKALDQLRNLPLEPSMVEAIVASKFFLKNNPVFNCLQSELIPIGLAFSLEVPYGGPSTLSLWGVHLWRWLCSESLKGPCILQFCLRFQ